MIVVSLIRKQLKLNRIAFGEKGEDSLRNLETHSGLSTLSLLMPLQLREESDECYVKC